MWKLLLHQLSQINTDLDAEPNTASAVFSKRNKSAYTQYNCLYYYCHVHSSSPADRTYSQHYIHLLIQYTGPF